MNKTMLKKAATFAGLLFFSILLMQFVWFVSDSEGKAQTSAPEKINLALRRTAHQLLVESGDSTSRIPPVEQTSPGVWLVRLEHRFPYDRLPGILQNAFETHGVRGNYDVAVLRCTDGVLMLGYNFEDFIGQNGVPCASRESEEGNCFNLQVSFISTGGAKGRMPLTGWFFSAALSAVLFGLMLKKKPRAGDSSSIGTQVEANWISFGNSRLDVANQVLVCGGESRQLTYRETKLLYLFVQRPNQVLERGFILANVWGDEGILVGRSVDMFVSRLRKILKVDSSVQISAVHGVGYRFQVM